MKSDAATIILSIEFGHGNLMISSHGTTAGRAIRIRPVNESHPIGEIKISTELEDRKEKAGDFFLHFINLESAKVLQRALNKMIETEGPWIPEPKTE